MTWNETKLDLKPQCCVYMVSILIDSYSPPPPGGLFQLLQQQCHTPKMLYSMTTAVHIKQRRLQSQGLHAVLNELAPQDIKVVSVKESCTAYQTVTIRPHILRNDPLHLRLGGERQSERWRKVWRGADCILQPVFWSDKHEVKIPLLPAGPHSNHCISHCCHLKHILPFPHPPLHLLSFIFIYIFHQRSI